MSPQIPVWRTGVKIDKTSTLLFPSTGRQTIAIERLCRALGIHEELESTCANRIEASRLLNTLRLQLKRRAREQHV